MQMYANMKTAVIDFSKGKTELQTMDDQMPIYIYILAMAGLKNPGAEFGFLEDYLRYQEKGYDTEQFILANLSVMSYKKAYYVRQV